MESLYNGPRGSRFRMRFNDTHTFSARGEQK